MDIGQIEKEIKIYYCKMDFDQLIILALDNNILLLESDEEGDVVRKLQEAGLLGISPEIPSDVIPLIQNFLPAKNLGRSLTTSRAFYQPQRLEIRDVVYWNFPKMIPEYITKVKLGPKGTLQGVEMSPQLTYLDLNENAEISNSMLYNKEFKHVITGLDLRQLTSLESEAIEDFVNLVILKLPDDVDDGDFVGTVFKNFPKLKELWIGENYGVDSDALKPLVNLEILHSGDSLINNLSFLPKLRVLFPEKSQPTKVNINALIQLEELHLDGIFIDEAYKNLVNLRVLEIDTGYINGKYFLNLINLEELILLSGNIQDEMNVLTSLKKLILPKIQTVNTTNK